MSTVNEQPEKELRHFWTHLVCVWLFLKDVKGVSLCFGSVSLMTHCHCITSPSTRKVSKQVKVTLHVFTKSMISCTDKKKSLIYPSGKHLPRSFQPLWSEECLETTTCHLSPLYNCWRNTAWKFCMTHLKPVNRPWIIPSYLEGNIHFMCLFILFELNLSLPR